MKPKWPKWVWVLTAEDFAVIGISLKLREVFGAKACHCDVWSALWFMALIHGGKTLTPALQSKIWNKIMVLLGYTEIYDA